MSDRPAPLLGRIAIKLGMITLDQLEEATHVQGRGGNRRLGQILVDLGYIDEAGLQRILRTREQVMAKQRAKQAVAKADARPEIAGRPTTPAAQRAASPQRQGKQATGETSQHAPSQPLRERPAAAPAADTDPEGLMALLQQGIELGASDVHVHAGSPPRMRVGGRFEKTCDGAIAPANAESMLLSALDAEQRRLFDEHGELDFSFSAPIGRFRVNVYRQQRGMDGVFRILPSQPPTLGELGLPTALAKFTNYHQGLVLVTGPANCGKSATLAALVDIVNEERREHVLTIEDPIEVVHPSKRCVVNQRAVGPHTGSFPRALRAALREDPDVIVIGELRDLETISLALTAAETGHLVLGTLHTNSAIRTLNRIAGVFPADQQDQVRNMVSESLRAVVSQRLVPTADGAGRVPALEILVVNKAVGNLIRENKTFQILSILQTGAAHGMCLLDESLARLVREGVIDRDAALRECEDPKRIPG
jgi:twitching motility protein PilT